MTQTDAETFKFVKEKLYVPVVSDVLDSLGYRNRAMHSRLRPVLPDIRNCGMVGRARTLRWMDVDYIEPVDPYGLELEAVDALEAGDVAVHSTDAGLTNAPWGELMSTIAKRKGVAGCICDSLIRDVVRIIDMGFPVYCAGFKPLDSMGRGMVKAYDVPIRCGDVLVKPGELIFGDFDGIVAIPREIERKVLDLAFEKVEKENLARQDLLNGESLCATYKKYGVL